MPVHNQLARPGGSQFRKPLRLGLLVKILIVGALHGPANADDQKYVAPKLTFPEKFEAFIHIDGCKGHLKFAISEKPETCEKQIVFQDNIGQHTNQAVATNWCQSHEAKVRSCLVNYPGFETQFVSIRQAPDPRRNIAITGSMNRFVFACVFRCTDFPLSNKFRYAGSSALLEPRTRNLEEAVERLDSVYAKQSDVDESIKGILGLLNSDSSSLNSADKAIIVDLIINELKEKNSSKNKELIDAVSLQVLKAIDSRLRETEKQVAKFRDLYQKELEKQKGN